VIHTFPIPQEVGATERSVLHIMLVVGTYNGGQRCISQIYAKFFVIQFPYRVVDDDEPSRNTMGFSGGLGSSPAAAKSIKFKISRLIMRYIIVLTPDYHELNALIRWLSERDASASGIDELTGFRASLDQGVSSF
jgi:hypothetical protein